LREKVQSGTNARAISAGGVGDEVFRRSDRWTARGASNAGGMRTRLRRYGSPVWLLLVGPLRWCQGAAPVRFVGVGGTFPRRTYTQWLLEFEKTRTNLHGSYLPFGSAREAEVVASGTADFAAGEVPEAPRLGNRNVLFFPVVVGAIVPIYNLPGVKSTLRFTPQALAGIYRGTITVGSIPRLPAECRGEAARVVRGGRRATYIWSGYLSKVSPEWRTKVGRGAWVRWPAGAEEDGNGNVAKAVRNTENSIGYVEMGYAVQMGMPHGTVENAAGRFVNASSVSLAAASACVIGGKSDFRCSITNPTGWASHPIASFTWFVLPETSTSRGKRRRSGTCCVDSKGWPDPSAGDAIG
jgi:phosphate transport system substrate-binding protein